MALFKYGILIFACVGTVTLGWSLFVSKKITAAARFFLITLSAGLLLAVYSIKIEPNWIEINRVKIKDADLADILGDTRIVHITDIHLTNGIGFRERQLIRKVNVLKPDIIFFTGDIIDDLTQIEPARELFSSLKPAIGIYGVPGDTDRIVIDGRSLGRELWPAGVDILVNETRNVQLQNGKSFWLIGIDNTNTSPQTITRALLGIPEGSPSVVIAPTPDLFEEVSDLRSNLLLVGDTHGGQIGIPLLIHLSNYANRTPYMKGLFKKDMTKMYVNKGIGTKTLPVRFLCRPEIAVIEVKK